ncbi:MAG: ABC transporter permease [Chloroflexi bacterium]|nr:ABC transporter permease [Chloroflexota bacterium]
MIDTRATPSPRPGSAPVAARPGAEPVAPDALRARHARKIRLGPAGWAGLALLATITLAAVFAPWVAPYDPRQTTGQPFSAPSAAHWLGTNDIGQDILSELIWGARVSLAIGVLAAVVGTALGTAAGVLGGYFRGRVDAFLMRTVDVVLVVPFLPLMILLAAYLGPSVGTLALVIGVLVWARPARVVRSVVLSQSARDYVMAARALGSGSGRILRLHILPSVLSMALAEFVQLASRSILLEAALAFLGLGDPIQKSWGSVLFYAQARGAFLSGAWVWWVLPPGLLITTAVLGFALLGFDMERIVNPRLRRR